LTAQPNAAVDGGRCRLFSVSHLNRLGSEFWIYGKSSSALDEAITLAHNAAEQCLHKMV